MRTMPEQDPTALPSHPEPQKLPAPKGQQLALPTPHRKVLLYILAAVFSLGTIILLLLMTGSIFPMRAEQKLLPLSLKEGGEEGVPLPLAALLAQAEQSYSSGDVRGALKLLEHALALRSSLQEGEEEGASASSGDTRILRRIFDIALLLGDQSKAESMLGLLSFRGMGEDVLDVLRGLLLLRSGDRNGARTLFQKKPENPEHAYGLVLLSLLEGTHDDAKEFLGVMQQSADPVLQREAAVIQGAYDEFALFEEGKETHLKTLLARSLADIQQCPSAAILLGEVTEEDPDYRDAWIVDGYCKLQLQDPVAALASFEKAYALDPEKAETQYFLGLSHERSGAATEAEKFFGYALQNGFQPELPLREKLAQLALRKGDYRKAEEQYRAALALSEGRREGVLDGSGLERAKFHHALVTVLLERLHDLPAADEAALQARDELGDIPIVLDLLGFVALAKGDVNQAAMFLNVAVEQDSAFAPAWYHKGLLAEEVGDTAEALRSYRQAYTLSLISDPALAVKAAERHNAIVMGEKRT